MESSLRSVLWRSCASISVCLATITMMGYAPCIRLQCAPISDSTALAELPAEEEVPGFFQRYDSRQLKNIMFRPYSSVETLPRRPVPLTANEKLLWWKSMDHPRTIESDALKSAHVGGIAFFGADVDATLVQQLVKVKDLEYFCLNGGSISPGALTGLEDHQRLVRVDLYGASGVTPEALASVLKAPRVSCVDVGAIDLSADHLDVLRNHSRLEAVVISPVNDNNVDVNLAQLFGGKRIRSFHIGNVRLTAAPASEDLAALREAQVTSCRGELGEFLSHLLRAPVLRELSLIDLDSDGGDFASMILERSSIRRVHVESVRGFNPAALLMELYDTEIESLSLPGYDLTMLPAQQDDAKYPQALTTLDVSGCKLGESAWTYIAGCTNLTELDLSKTKLNATSMIALKKLPQLESIVLAHTVATEEQLIAIASSPSLRLITFAPLTNRSDELIEKLLKANKHLEIR